MTSNIELGKKSGGRPILKRLFYGILVLILVIIVAAAALYTYLKIAGSTGDNVAAITSAETMPASERYSFDESSHKMEMSIDKSDLWWLLKQFNYEDTIAVLADNLKRNGLTLQSYGMDITDKGILISAEITDGNLLRLPLKISTNTTISNGTITISPTGLYLGKIKLSMEKFPLNRLMAGSGIDPESDLDAYACKISLSDWNLMSMLTDIYFKDNRMVMVYKLDESLFSSSLSAYKRELGWFSGECTNCIETLGEYSRKGALGERFTGLMKSFEANPESFSDFIAETLAVSNESDSKEYLNKNKLMLARFMPEITENRVKDSHTSLYKLCSERSSLFDKLLDTLLVSYNSLKFGIDGKGFKYNNEPFDLVKYMGKDWEKYSGWLDASTFRPVLIDTINADDTKTPLLRKITNSIKNIDNVESINKRVPLGFIVKMQDGTPVLKYNNVIISGRKDTAMTVNQTIVLDNPEYEAMMKNPLVPVWRN